MTKLELHGKIAQQERVIRSLEEALAEQRELYEAILRRRVSRQRKFTAAESEYPG